MENLQCPLARLKLAITRLRKCRHNPANRTRYKEQATWPQFCADVNLVMSHDRELVNSRWIVSILDTFVDYGSEQESRNAMMGVLLANWERARATVDAGECNKPLRPYVDGLKLFATNSKEDAHRNMCRRLRRLMEATPVVSDLFAELYRRVLTAPNGTLAKLNSISSVQIIKQCNDAILPLRKQAVPKIAHFVWMGENEMSGMANANILAFRALHPGWEIRLWRELPPDAPSWVSDKVRNAPLLCQKTDIVRAWALHKFGGIYLDCDVVPVRDSTQLLERAPWAIMHWRKPCNAVMCDFPAGNFTGTMLELIRNTQPTSRISYGPALLIAMQKQKVAPEFLPPEYWTFFPRQARRQAFFEAGSRRRNRMIKRRSTSFTPFGVHVGTGLNAGAPSRGRTSAALRRIDGAERIGAEIGVFKALNASCLLRAKPNLTLHLVDRWQTATERYALSGDANSSYTQQQWSKIERTARRAVRFAGSRAIVHKASSVDAAAMIPDSSLDFVFLDAEHSEEAVSEDLAAWWPKIKPNGWIGGHDYRHPREHDGRWGVSAAVDAWALITGVQVETDEDLTWFAWKRDAP